MALRSLFPVALLVLLLAAAAWVLIRQNDDDRAADGGRPGAAGAVRTPDENPAPMAVLPSPMRASAFDGARADSSASEDEVFPGGTGVRLPEESTQLVIKVLHHDGRPAECASVVIFRGETVLASGSCDRRGVAVLPPGDGDASFFVDAISGTVLGRLDSIAAGRRRVVLPEGLTIAGRVLVDGREPGEPVELVIVRDGSDPALRELPGSVRARTLENERQRSWRFGGDDEGIRLETQADGTFARSGFPPGWSGRIILPGWQHRVVFGDGQSPSDRPRTMSVPVSVPSRAPIVIALRSLPKIRGRVVAAQDGPPLAQRWLDWEAHTVAGGRASARLRTDDEGRFEIVLDYGPIASVVLELMKEEEPLLGLCLRKVVPGPVETDLDLGDLVPASARKVLIDVRRPDGAPVVGAVASFEGIDGDGGGRTGMSDASGRLAIPVPAEVCRVRIDEPSSEPQSVDVPDPAAAPLPAVLSPATEVRVRVLSADGTPRERFRVRVRAPEPPHHLFREGDEPSNVGFETSSWESDRVAFQCVAKKDTVVIRRLLSGIPIVVETLSASGGLVASEPIRLEPGGSREIMLRVPGRNRTFRGMVVDESGAPLPGAFVSFASATGPGEDGAGTGEDGRFEMRDVFALRGRLTIHAEGHVPCVRSDYLLPPEREEPRFVLDRGRSLTVTVVDADRNLFERLKMIDERFPIWIEAGDQPGMRWSPEMEPTQWQFFRSSTAGDGIYRFDGLPDSEVLIHVEDGARRVHVQRHDPAIDTARVVLPLHGSVHVIWDFPVFGDAQHRIRLSDRPDPDGPEILREIPSGGPTSFPIERLPPGTYAVVLERGEEPERSRPEQWVPLSRPDTVTVIGGETAVVHLAAR